MTYLRHVGDESGNIVTSAYNSDGDSILPSLNEPILPDDYPVHQGYLYVANGRVTEFIDGEGMTVGKWKALRIEGVTPITEVRRYDGAGRLERRMLQEGVKAVTHHVVFSEPRTFKQKRRKPRSSNKIKKVK